MCRLRKITDHASMSDRQFVVIYQLSRGIVSKALRGTIFLQRVGDLEVVAFLFSLPASHPSFSNSSTSTHSGAPPANMYLSDKRKETARLLTESRPNTGLTTGRSAHHCKGNLPSEVGVSPRIPKICPTASDALQ